MRLPITIRPMTVGDLDDVYECEIHGHEFPWSKGIILDCIRVGYQCWVLEEYERIQGFSITTCDSPEAHLLNLCVHPRAHRKGYGRRLLVQLLGNLKNFPHVDTLILEVRPTNHAAIKLYEQYNFHQIGVRKDYYQSKEGRQDALLLSRKMNPTKLF